MIPWYGHGGNHINIGLPHYIPMDCKPNNSGKIQNLADVSSGIMIFLKVVKSADKEKAIKKDLDLNPKEAAYGKGNRVLMEMTKTWHCSNCLVTVDAYFTSTKAALKLKKVGVDFIGNVKQCNAAFPKTYLKLLILSKHGDCHVLASISKDTGETKLVAMTWLDCNRQDFVGTVNGIGEGDQINWKRTRQLNKSSNALPNNIIIKVGTPKMIKQYYKGVGTINFHNRVRVDKVRLECNILAKGWARRFNLGIFGMICTGTRLFYRHIVHNGNKKGSYHKFFGSLTDKLINNTQGICMTRTAVNGGCGGSKTPHVEVDNSGKEKEGEGGSQSGHQSG
jgi:hypothetical protein